MIEAGTTVKVHYKVTLNDGMVFDSSEGRDPISFEVGGGNSMVPIIAAASERRTEEGRCLAVMMTQDRVRAGSSASPRIEEK